MRGKLALGTAVEIQRDVGAPWEPATYTRRVEAEEALRVAIAERDEARATLVRIEAERDAELLAVAKAAAKAAGTDCEACGGKGWTKTGPRMQDTEGCGVCDGSARGPLDLARIIADVKVRPRNDPKETK